MKYKAIYYFDTTDNEVIGTYDNRDDAIYALLKKGDNNYCLDSYDIRKKALEERNFCMIGCGPASMEIVEV